MQKEPAVTPLPVYLPESTSHHQYHHHNDQHSTLSLLHRYFIRPTGTFIDDAGSIRLFDDVTYTEYFTFFVSATLLLLALQTCLQNMKL